MCVLVFISVLRAQIGAFFVVNEALMCKKSDWLPFKCPTRSPTLSDGCIGDWLRETYAIWFNEVSPAYSSYGEEVIYSL